VSMTVESFAVETRSPVPFEAVTVYSTGCPGFTVWPPAWLLLTPTTGSTTVVLTLPDLVLVAPSAALSL
jgi:hypothetical protein